MSMFLDTAKISVKAGRGGDGMVAFRREKYVPNGGPWGGDGGKGGSVIFKVDEGLRTLMDFRYNRKFKAKNGEKGMTKGMHGRGAEDLIVSIPPGTTVRDAETGKVITDMVEDGQEFVIAHGGRGGRGNIRFATPRNPAPEIAENGEPGEERELQLELKILKKKLDFYRSNFCRKKKKLRVVTSELFLFRYVRWLIPLGWCR